MFHGLVGVVLGPACLHPYIPANTPTQFLQALVERCKSILTFRAVRSPVHEDTDPPHTLVLLRAGRERPRGRRAAEQRDELAAFHLRGHSITSSAPAESPIGTSIPSARAVLRLSTNSNLTIWITGSSPGLSPL